MHDEEVGDDENAEDNMEGRDKVESKLTKSLEKSVEDVETTAAKVVHDKACKDEGDVKNTADSTEKMEVQDEQEPSAADSVVILDGDEGHAMLDFVHSGRADIPAESLDTFTKTAKVLHDETSEGAGDYKNTEDKIDTGRYKCSQ